MSKLQTIAIITGLIGVLLIFTALAFVGIWFPTSDGGSCQFILWQTRCYASNIGVAPGDVLGMLFAVTGDMIVALGVLLVVTASVAMLYRLFWKEKSKEKST